MTDDQIKDIEKMRDHFTQNARHELNKENIHDALRSARPAKVLTEALAYIRDTREMLEAAWFIKLDNGGLTRYANQGWSNGNEPKWYDSALAAWRDGVRGE